MAGVATYQGRGRVIVLSERALELARRERLTRAERARENVPLPPEAAEEHLDAGGLDPLDRPPTPPRAA